MATKILLVEDDESIIQNLSHFLRSEGFCVDCATGQKEAEEKLTTEHYDLCLLDISLSDGNGFALCSFIKKEHNIPVIFLTASGDEYSTLTGFEIGADDYVPKPFRPRELVSRIKNVIRRTGKNENIIKLNNLSVDMVKGTVSKNSQELFLSALEYRLLLVFVNNRGLILSRNKLLEEIWDIAGEFVNDNTLTVYIKRLREKIEDNPQNPIIIKTIRGLGYRMD
jgi:DNA-binding response OmpR family regulator